MTDLRPSILDDCPLSPDVNSTSIQARIYCLLFVQGEHALSARIAERLIVTAIVLSTASLVGDSITGLDPWLYRVFWFIEIAVAILFALEYSARLWSVTASCSYRQPVIGRLRYAVTFFAIVDLVSLAPLLSLLFGTGIEFFAIARLARLLKLGRYSIALRSLVAVFCDRCYELLAALGILLAMLLIAATGIYLAEYEAQPEAFQSIPHSLWWSVVTITTLGYGDITPVTPLGRIFASVIVIVGLLIIAIPTGIVSAGFFDEFQRRRRAELKCPRCGEHYSDQS